MAWEQPQSSDVGMRGLPRVLDQTAPNAFLAKVYRWMFGGLTLTGLVALYVASNPAWTQLVARNMLVLVFAELGLVLALSALLPRLSAAAASGMFLAYAALNGVTLSLIFWVYQLGSIAEAFFLAGGVFGAMSLYAKVTKKDLSGWRTFLFMGLVGVVLTSVVNLFLQSDAVSFVTSCATVVVFAGLTAYDTQKLRTLAGAGSGGGTLAIHGALMLYLDFINLFLAFLRIFGRRR